MPQEEGGPDTADNAAPLCSSCHDKFGGHPGKRKMIREARDNWYEICSKRFADAPEVDELRRLLAETVAAIKNDRGPILEPTILKAYDQPQGDPQSWLVLMIVRIENASSEPTTLSAFADSTHLQVP